MRSDAPRASEPEESFRGLLSELVTASEGLVRDEINLAKQEVREKIRSLKTGILRIAVAVVLGMIALVDLNAALVAALGKRIGLEVSALIVGIAAALVAGILAGLGMAQIRRMSLKPKESISSLKDDKEWLKRAVGRGWSAVAKRTPKIEGP
jgi:uncharacterized membrane protein YqjE